MSGPSTDGLSTPAVVVDLDVLERNVARMAARAREAGVRLRPHAKTHKCPRDRAAPAGGGAGGLSLAKVGEAEVFADAGFDDLFVAYPVVGEDKGRRLLALSDRCAGSRSASTASRARARWRRRSTRRAGRSTCCSRSTWATAAWASCPRGRPDVATRLAELPGLRLRGVFTHAGHAYWPRRRRVSRTIARLEGERLAADCAPSCGRPACPWRTSPWARRRPRATRCASRESPSAAPATTSSTTPPRSALGTCGLEDCALTILATVVSVPAPDRAVVDAGSKTLSSDPLRPRAGGYGLVAGPGEPDREALRGARRRSRCAEGESFRVGERVRSCPTTPAWSRTSTTGWSASAATRSRRCCGGGAGARQVGRAPCRDARGVATRLRSRSALGNRDPASSSKRHRE